MKYEIGGMEEGERERERGERNLPNSTRRGSGRPGTSGWLAIPECAATIGAVKLE